MYRQLLTNHFGTIVLQRGMPPTYASCMFPHADVFHAHGPWGLVCLQEVQTPTQVLHHFLFVLQQTFSFSIENPHQGLQSLLNLKGEFSHCIEEQKEVLLKEKEFVLFHSGPTRIQTTVGRDAISGFFHIRYHADSYETLLPLFPGFQASLKKAFQQSVTFLHQPRVARYSVLDAIQTLWFDRYLPSLQLKHLEIRLESSLFTLLAQTYSPSQSIPSPYEREKAAAARDFVLRDIRIHYTLEEVAHAIHCSSSWLKKTFRKVYGVGLFHYLRRTRMERARELFIQGESLKAVAIEVGMAPRNFPKEFKAYFGYTVTAFKKSLH